MTDPSTSANIRKPDHVLVQHLPDDETVFLDLRTEEYFGLDPVGTAMWNALLEAGGVDSAFHRLLAEFDVHPDTLRNDLHILVGELETRGLLLLDPEQNRTDPTPDRS